MCGLKYILKYKIQIIFCHNFCVAVIDLMDGHGLFKIISGRS